LDACWRAPEYRQFRNTAVPSALNPRKTWFLSELEPKNEE
jgi:hypothetical protein